MTFGGRECDALGIAVVSLGLQTPCRVLARRVQAGTGVPRKVVGLVNGASGTFHDVANIVLYGV